MIRLGRVNIPGLCGIRAVRILRWTFIRDPRFERCGALVGWRLVRNVGAVQWLD
jgi:hypothetical protein